MINNEEESKPESGSSIFRLNHVVCLQGAHCLLLWLGLNHSFFIGNFVLGCLNTAVKRTAHAQYFVTLYVLASSYCT